jgi:uncharacterized membrane protein YfcA
VPDGAILILAGAFAGGFVSGLTGFGTGITALPIWVYAVAPVLAGPLVVVCSIIGQIQTIPAIWHAIEFRRSMPFIVGGLVGVPLGTYLLPHIPLNAFRLTIAVLLIVNCGFMLLRRIPFRVTWGGRVADGFIGWLGGILGGLSGTSGPPPTIWSGLRGWDKDTRRGVLQSYNLTILTFAFITQMVAGLITLELGRVVLIALPGTILGAFVGRRVYNKLDNVRFDRVVLVLLMISGVALLVTTLRAMSR